jgi:hypothetical protein
MLPALWCCALQVFVLNRTQEILQQQEDTLQRAVQKLEQKAGVQVRWHIVWHCCCDRYPTA